MRFILLLMVMWAGAVCYEAGQDERLPANFKPYRCLKQLNFNTETQTWKPGAYFVLVSADWCVPCQALKVNLGHYNHIPIYFVDYDKDQALAKRIMGSHRTLPCLVRYDLAAEGNRRTLYRYGTELDRFLATSILEPPKQPDD